PPPPGQEGTNGFGSVGYRGPCPPEGDEPHRYTFTLYAVDRPIDLERGFSSSELEAALVGHVVARGHLIGTYGR
ncbi:MAG TPA: YbhB/YbcL family Raf kinase inhibitor-like protein, partial [Nitriliruptorales bacterium]|nr:YbhB/YbcL family Raf kinase inhibitor-like protein [Nitriliruptorales bacterium]